ncbi:phosphoribosylaminoimidazole carboxylase [bacterium]|nr:phosphoribosylaminoimidazole carboxylase [bacterium]MBU3956027.1 phosphoribosylaminoimidazole carboxylase [bacterium]
MDIEKKNLFKGIPSELPSEIFNSLIVSKDFTLERIVSEGHTTPAGEWLEQERDEWVILFCGGAKILFEEGKVSKILKPGDYLNIPVHCRHRVEWTDPEHKTVWLALHYRAG